MRTYEELMKLTEYDFTYNKEVCVSAKELVPALDFLRSKGQLGDVRRYNKDTGEFVVWWTKIENYDISSYTSSLEGEVANEIVSALQDNYIPLKEIEDEEDIDELCSKVEIEFYELKSQQAPEFNYYYEAWRFFAENNCACTDVAEELWDGKVNDQNVGYICSCAVANDVSETRVLDLVKETLEEMKWDINKCIDKVKEELCKLVDEQADARKIEHLNDRLGELKRLECGEEEEEEDE